MIYSENSYLKLLRIMGLNLFIASIIILVLNWTRAIDSGLLANSNVIFIVGLIFGLCSLFLWHKKRQSNFTELFFKASPYIFLVLLAIIALNQFFKWTFVTEQIARFVILAITFGAVTFWRNRDRINTEMESEKSGEEQSESQRRGDFAHKFPRINRIWGVRSLVKWMYVESWQYSGALILIMVVGFVLRISKLGDSLWIDETYSYLAINGILNHGIPVLNSGLVYFVSPFYHYICALLFVFFRNLETSLRLVSILSGTGLIAISYLYFREIIGKKISLTLTIPLAISSYFISLSVFGRHYSLFLFLFFSTLYFINSNLKNKTYFIIISFLLCLFTHVFAVLLFPALFYGVYSKKIKIENRLLRGVFYISPLLLIMYMFLSVRQIQERGLSFLIQSITQGFDISQAIEFIVKDFSLIAIFIALCGFISLIFVKKINYPYVLTITSIVLSYGYYLKIANFRYISLLMIPVFALFLYGSFGIIRILKIRIRMIYVVLICLILLLVNVNYSISTSLEKQYLYDLPLPDFKKVYEHISDSDKIIVSATWGGAPAEVYLKNYVRKNNYIFNEVEGSYNLFTYDSSRKEGVFLDAYSSYLSAEDIRDKYSNTILINNIDQLQEISYNNAKTVFVLDHNRLGTVSVNTILYLLSNYVLNYDLSSNLITVFDGPIKNKPIKYVDLQLTNFTYLNKNGVYYNLVPSDNQNNIKLLLAANKNYTLYLSWQGSSNSQIILNCNGLNFDLYGFSKKYINLFNLPSENQQECLIFIKDIGSSKIETIFIVEA